MSREKPPAAQAAAEPKLVAVYKEVGPTSHDLLYRLKKRFPGQKIGHAGTLDPLASGVLVVGIGRAATKRLHAAELDEKEYVVEITFGQSSATDDAEGEKTDWPVSQQPSREKVQAALAGFVGTINQTPPAFSAIKRAGVPAYKLARRGQAVELEARPALIKEIELIGYDWPLLTLRVVTGRGVYIRSLARDIGAVLGVGGFVSQLERTRVGRFSRSEAMRIDDPRLG